LLIDSRRGELKNVDKTFLNKILHSRMKFKIILVLTKVDKVRSMLSLIKIKENILSEVFY
jgi:GTP-binding protein EngB required for normal cell division